MPWRVMACSSEKLQPQIDFVFPRQHSWRREFGRRCLVLPRTVTTNAATQQVTYGNVYNQLLEYIVSADLVFYLLMVVAVILLRRKKPNAERPYRTWGYPIVPIISIVLSALLTIDLAWLAPATSGIGILIVLTGVPAYFLWRLRGARHASPV